VFICEGEKDAINVSNLGLVATTPGGGIPKSWTSDLNKWFVGRTVYILEDNDATGRAHVGRVAEKLRDHAGKIGIIEFRDLTEHGDVSDWIAQGGTKAKLLDLAVNARSPSKGYELVLAEDVLPRNIDWLWFGHLAANTLELLAGVPGAGKSQIQDCYVACVTTGIAWPDGANGQGRRNVIMMTAEDNLDDTLVPRLIAAGADLKRVRFFTLNSHMATDVRAQLGPLKDFSQRLLIDISAITTHPRTQARARLINFWEARRLLLRTAKATLPHNNFYL
jgi:AAA domain